MHEQNHQQPRSGKGFFPLLASIAAMAGVVGIGGGGGKEVSGKEGSFLYSPEIREQRIPLGGHRFLGGSQRQRRKRVRRMTGKHKKRALKILKHR